MLGRLLLLGITKLVWFFVKTSCAVPLTPKNGSLGIGLPFFATPSLLSCKSVFNNNLMSSFLTPMQAGAGSLARTIPDWWRSRCWPCWATFGSNVPNCNDPRWPHSPTMAYNVRHWLDLGIWSIRKRYSSLLDRGDIIKARDKEPPASVSVVFKQVPRNQLLTELSRLISMMGCMMLLWYLVPTKRRD